MRSRSCAVVGTTDEPPRVSRGWPVALAHGQIGVRPLRLRDGAAWVAVRQRNEAWLTPWEGLPEGQPWASWADRNSPAVYGAMLRSFRRETRAGRLLAFAITYQGQLVGQVTVSTIVRGAYAGATLGYWVDGAVAGRGIAPVALALVVDHCFAAVGLHRVEANVRPENAASRRVLDKLAFREEGLHRRYLHLDGGWRDHASYALTRGELTCGVLRTFLDKW